MTHQLFFIFEGRDYSKRILTECSTCHETSELLSAPAAFRHRGEVFEIPQDVLDQYRNYRGSASSPKGTVRFI